MYSLADGYSFEWLVAQHERHSNGISVIRRTIGKFNELFNQRFESSSVGFDAGAVERGARGRVGLLFRRHSQAIRSGVKADRQYH